MFPAPGRGRFSAHAQNIEGMLKRRYNARTALKNGLLFVYYQPIFDLAKNTITGVEAFLRWCDPQGKIVNPTTTSIEFHDRQLAVDLGHELRRQILRDLAGWHVTGTLPAYVALPVPIATLMDSRLPTVLSDIVTKEGISPGRFRLEIDVSLAGPAARTLLRDQLEALRKIGFRLVLDGLGNGYVTERSLAELPFDFFKIHRSVLAEFQANAGSSLPFLQQIIALASEFGCSVMVEGVETQEQFSLLRALGCGEAQGFLFAAPMSPEKLMDYLPGHEVVEGCELLSPLATAARDPDPVSNSTPTQRHRR